MSRPVSDITCQAQSAVILMFGEELRRNESSQAQTFATNVFLDLSSFLFCKVKGHCDGALFYFVLKQGLFYGLGRGTLYVNQASLKLTIYLPLPPRCWN